MLDPIFDLLAGLLAWFYSLVPSYGFAIIALTFLVLVVFAPLTYKSTKSMVAMRRLQPQVKRIQRKHAGDREAMNQEMMALYQEHGVSPLSGCLPILIQSPVFIVMFRVIRGITRRSSTIGFSSGDALVARELSEANYVAAETPLRDFNPEYLSKTSNIYQDLSTDNEMMWIGLDLSRTPWEVVQESFSKAIPYIIMIAVVAVLGWYQQRQIAGRASGEISSQQQMIMRIMPWFLPVFAVTMPAGLVLYFIVSSLLRVIQQAYITRTVYSDESLTTPIELDDDDDFDDDDSAEPESPFAALFGAGSKPKAGASVAPAARHGSRRPTTTTGASSRGRSRPPRTTAPSSTGSSSSKGTKSSKGSTNTRSTSSSSTADTSGGIWGRARRAAPSQPEAPARPASRRVTPKGTDRRNKK